MRVIQILPDLNEGGVERGVVDLNKEYSKLGIDNIVISNGGRLVSDIKRDGGTHIEFDVASKNILTIIPRVISLKNILKNLNPDIIHVRSRVPAWLVYFANKSLKFKIVSTVHGFNSVSFYSKIMTVADSVICGSKFMIEHIVKHYNVNRNKIYLVPRGIDEDYFNSQNLDEEYIKDITLKYNLKDKTILTQVARITHWKDQETMIKALHKVINSNKDKYYNLKLLLVGGYSESRESYYSTLLKLVEELSLKDNVVFLGHTNKIKEVFSITSINLSASNKPETFGRANVEGMFLGIPLLGTNIGATSDYIIEGKTGLYFEPKNVEDLTQKMIEILDTKFDKDFIIDFSRNNFSLRSMVEKNLEVYRKLI